MPPKVGNTAGFESAELVRLFETIDKLRECGVSEDISLPQLVVAGDQSSGKSSVLEALTGIPFPVASKLCTRYATQINFRRTPHEYVNVSITPSPDSDSSRLDSMRAFHRHVPNLTEEIFSDILADASKAMGLPIQGEELTAGSGARFSDDILKIELCGPNKPHFSVVDVPGLFENATTFQTTEDVKLVENMVVRYLNEPRTIILAVATSLHEAANQKVFSLAEKADPKGLRTVGLLTKPDAVQIGDEQTVIDVARNRVINLTHGWYVVRNRSTDEVRKGVTAEGRLKNEKAFFATAPWNTLEKSRVGIPALERRLRQLLYDHIRREYPLLVKELELKVQDLRAQIEELGPPRENAEQQRSVLIEAANLFQNTARDSILGRYGPEHESDELRLRTTIRKMNDMFAQKIKTQGHLHEFSTQDEEKTKLIHDWILDVYSRSRGLELDGMIPAGVFQTLFRKQSEGWEAIAKDHVIMVNQSVNEFIRTLLQEKCADESLYSSIAGYLGPRFSKTLDNAMEELSKILQCERGDCMLTYDDTFLLKLDEIRKTRLMEEAKSQKGDVLANANCGEEEQKEAFSLQKFLSAIEACTKSRSEQSVIETFEYLRSYYIGARTRFIDCVAMQVIERHFLSAGGSVQMFSPALVGKMTPEELRRIAGEDMGVISKRGMLAEKLGRLENARAIANSGYV
ncbi:dynamin [Pyronema domesticum]|nr:dynamin [Pyronema domesticum]